MKIDNEITRKIQKWLDTPDTERDLREGADLMLSLNRNRALYNSILRRPEKFKAKLIYELRKFLRIRLDNLSVNDVARIEKEVLPRIEETVKNPPVISTDDELPQSSGVAKGKRPDHDSLPKEIRDLWDSNGERHRRIVLLFNEIKAMSDAQPCDRYEKLHILDDLDKTYRKNLELYDAYVPTDEPDGDPRSVPVEVVKAIGAARKTISKYKKVLASNPDDPEKVETAKAKIISAVNVIVSSGSNISEASRIELEGLGVTFG